MFFTIPQVRPGLTVHGELQAGPPSGLGLGAPTPTFATHVPHFLLPEQRHSALPLQRRFLLTPPTFLAWMPEQTSVGATHELPVHWQASFLRQAFFA